MIAGRAKARTTIRGRNVPKRTRRSRVLSSDNKPSWNGETRTLTFRGLVVKRFRQPSRHQNLILDALEELGWPSRIDDPLTGDGHTDPKERLHNATQNLNRRQQNALIRFHGDGTGEGITWEVVETR